MIHVVTQKKYNLTLFLCNKKKLTYFLSLTINFYICYFPKLSIYLFDLNRVQLIHVSRSKLIFNLV